MKTGKIYLFTAALLIAAALCAAASADVEINETNFPDASFRNCVTGFDSNADGVLSDSEIVTVTEINCSQSEICSMKGIEFFCNLTSLDCSTNQLASLDVSRNTELKMLECGANPLKSLDVRQNTKLTELHCYTSGITELDVSRNTMLETLLCSNSKLGALDVGKNTALTTLYCNGNLLNTLDVSRNTALVKLSFANNPITSIDVSRLAKLDGLECGGTLIKALDISGCKKLVALTKKADPGYFTFFGVESYGWCTSSTGVFPQEFLFIDKGLDLITEAAGSATASGGRYELNAKKTAAVFTGPVNKNARTLKIRDTVKIGGKSYKVTGIKARACRGMKKLTTLVIGKNVTKIGARAFENCAKLETITIRNAKMKQSGFGSGCFRKIYAKATFKVPKKMLGKYKAWIAGKGKAPGKVRVEAR